MDGTFRSRTTSLLSRTAASLALAAAALSFAAPAQAADPAVDFAAGSPAVQAAETIARDYWQDTPCAGQVSLVWMRLTEATNATATWTNPVGQYDAPDQNGSCQIAFNSALPWDWTRFCSILVHEYGHLNGHAHAEATSDVMFAFYEAPVAQCVAAAPAVAPAPAAAVAVAAAPVVKAAAATKPRAISSTRIAKRGVLVAVSEPRRHAKRGHQHRKHRAKRHHKQRQNRGKRLGWASA